MKSFLSFVLALGLCAAAPLPDADASAQVPAQSPAQPQTTTGGKAAPGVAPSAAPSAAPSEAQALYEEADTYAGRKFDEFRKNAVPYNKQLEQKTFQEQRDMALRPDTSRRAGPWRPGPLLRGMSIRSRRTRSFDSLRASFPKLLRRVRDDNKRVRGSDISPRGRREQALKWANMRTPSVSSKSSCAGNPRGTKTCAA